MTKIGNDLVQRCQELLEWKKTGLLAGGNGGAVRALAERLQEKVGETYALRVAEDQTKDDAMREVVRLASSPPAQPDLVRALEEIRQIMKHHLWPDRGELAHKVEKIAANALAQCAQQREV